MQGKSPKFAPYGNGKSIHKIDQTNFPAKVKFRLRAGKEVYTEYVSEIIGGFS